MAAARRMKKLLIGSAVVLVLLIVLIVFLPALLSQGIGQRIINGGVEAQVNGTSAIRKLRLTWSGPQVVTGLTVTDLAGKQVADLDVTLGGSLLAIALGSLAEFDVQLTGRLAGELYEDGSSSFQKLLAVEAKDGKDDSTESAEPPAEGEAVAATVQIDGVEVTLDLVSEDEQGKKHSQGTIVLDQLTGRLRYEPGGTSAIELESTTTAGDLRGSMDIRVSAPNLVAANGAMTLAQSGLDASIVMQSVPVPFDDAVDEVRALVLTAQSKALSSQVDLTVRAETIIEGYEASTLTGNLKIDHPVSADGGFSVGFDTVTGNVIGQRVPVALLQPLLAGTPILLRRDVGPLLDVSGVLSGGSEKDIFVSLAAERLEFEAAGRMAEDRSLVGNRLRLTSEIQPELLAAIAGEDGGVSIERPAGIAVSLGAFSIPAREEDQPFPWDAVGLTGSVTISEPLPIVLGAGEGDRLTLEQFNVAVDTPALAEGIHLTGSAYVDNGRIEFDEQLRYLFDEDRRFALTGLEPTGRISIKDLPGSRIASLMPEEARSPTLSHLLQGTLNASLQTQPVDTGLHGQVDLKTDLVQASASMIRRPDALHLASGRATMTVTPALLETIESGDDAAVTLTGPATATIDLLPMSLPGSSLREYTLPEGPILGRLTLTAAQFTTPRVSEPVRIGQLTADIAATLGTSPEYRATGAAELDLPSSGKRIASLQYDVGVKKDGDTFVPAGTATLEQLDVKLAESLLSLTAGAISGWVGASGSLGVELSGSAAARDVKLVSDLPNLKGTFRASLSDDILDLRAEDLSMTLARETLERVLNPAPDDTAGAETRAEPLLVPADVPVSVALKQLRVPLALATGEKVDPAAVRIDAAVTSQQLSLADSKGELLRLTGLTATVGADGLSEGLTYRISSAARARGSEKPGMILIDGSIRNVLSPESTFDWSAAKINTNARFEGVPAAVPDTFLDLDGLLVAAVGEIINASFDVQDLERVPGRIDVSIDNKKTGGPDEIKKTWVKGILKGRDEALWIEGGVPLNAELDLTRALRDRILAKIHPLLADIRTTDPPGTPMKITLSNSVLPLDGNVNRLFADINIAVGKVEFDQGSFILSALKLAQRQTQPTVPGFIEPIQAKIANGIVTYDKFAVTVGTYRMTYVGRIDLNTRSLDLSTQLPALAISGDLLKIKELERLGDVPVTVRYKGSLDNPKIELDLKALIDAAAKRGLGDLLGDILGEKSPFGDLGGLLKPPKKDK